MLRMLIAILMIVTLGAAVLGGCDHGSAPVPGKVMAAHSGHEEAPGNSHESSPGHCCQLHCHQHLSLAPLGGVNLILQVQATAFRAYRVQYAGPALALLTRPPLAA